MILATARVLQNVIETRVGDELWTCRPVGGAANPIARKIEELFSTVYRTYRPSAPDEIHSTVSYHPKNDEIIVQVGEEKWRTKSSVFGPLTLVYGGIQYTINEKLTGRFAMLRGGKVIATGEVGFRTCKIKEYPAELEMILADLALGYLIRTLFWEMLR